MFRLSLAVCIGLGLLANGAPVAAGCDRDALLEAAGKYVEAQTAGKLDALQDLLDKNFTYQENNKVIAVEDGVISLPLVIDHSRSTADTTNCASYSELVSSKGSKPYVIGTQIRHDPESMAITMVDSVAATTGAWLFDAAKTLSIVLQEDDAWTIIPEDKRDSRELLQQAADAYLDIWSNATAQDAVPWGTPCRRLEGSAYTGSGAASDTCTVGIPTNHNQAPNTHRRYVIDEAMGTCQVLCVWEHMMMAADSHEFRLENGKLRYVHAITMCPGQTCRL
jgi:hypothetical protein